MTNQVDTSQQTIDREWARIASEHKALEQDTASEPEALPPVDSEQPLNFEDIEGVNISGDNVPSAPPVENTATLEEKIALAEMAINGALVFVFDAIGGLDIPKDKYARLSKAWAVVIAKRFEGGIFEFMAKYKDELSAVGATVVFIGAVREGVKVKREQVKESRTEKAVQVQDSKESDDVQH